MDNSTIPDISFSQTAVEAVVQDIRTGDADYVEQFFAARPDWQESGEGVSGDDE